ncbi:Transcriptional activator of fatty acid utilization [Entomortierella lignicola]|nr:Transcriptional activator of fatty acid utilization [Entomortierella lignicola]
MSAQDDSKRRRVSRACFNDSAKKRGPPKGYIEALENRLHRMENLLGGLVQNGDRPKADLKTDLDNWREEQDDDFDPLDSAWPSHSPETPTLSQPLSDSPASTDISKTTPCLDDTPEPENDNDVLPYDVDARKKINALSEGLNSMTLDDGGFIKYLGNSSGIDLLQKSQILKNGYLMVPVRIRDHRDWLIEKESNIQQLISEMTLPPRDLAEHLLEIYWIYVHPHLPVVHKPTFMRQYRNPDPEKQPPMVLLNAMFSMASRFSNHPEIVGHGHDPEGFGDEYFARAKRIVDLEYELPRQSSIQALLLMVAYRFTSAKSGGRVWVMLGMATRMAQDLGMHRNSARWHLPPMETEIRKRIWWALYVMDRWVSASMGRPLGIDDNDCDVGYPSEIEQDWIDGDGDPTSLQEDNEKLRQESSFALTYFVENIKLARIVGQILSRIYGAVTRTHGPIQVSSTVAELDTMLTKWLLDLPQDLKYDHETMASNTKICRWTAFIHSAYYVTLILLHRPYMVPTSLTKSKLSESLPSLNIAVSAANSITHLLEKLDKDNQLQYSWNSTAYEVFTSSLIHLTNSASIDIRLQTQARKNLVKNIEFMKKLGERWFHAEKFSGLLEDLVCAHLNFDEYNPDGRSMDAVAISIMKNADSGCPIVLRDQTHPSGGSLLFAPKPYGVPATPSSTTTTPGSSPSMPLVHNPDAQDTRKHGTASLDLAISHDSSTVQNTVAGPSSPVAAVASAANRQVKKSRKSLSQRNSLLFQSPSSNVTTPASSSGNPTSSTTSTSLTMPESNFTFSSLSTPGMFAQGQAFMNYDQMMAQQQFQLQQKDQSDQALQPFSSTPLFSSPFALQFRNNGNGEQQPSTSSNSMVGQPENQQLQQQQQYMQFQQQQIDQHNQSSQALPLTQSNNFLQGSTTTTAVDIGTSQYSNPDLSHMDSFGFIQASAGASGMNLSNSISSAIPSGIEDYSNFSLFPQPQQQQQQQQQQQAAVPNPFFGIPNTIDWDEWNQYIASAGLQKP